MKRYHILIITPNLTASGGVSSYWNALLPVFYKFRDISVKTIEVGGHGKNIFGLLLDQWNFRKKISSPIDLAFLNPSLGSRSFFRDAFFAKQLIKKKIPFVVFFHGWDLDFEKIVNEKYMNFFSRTFGQAKKIFVLSQDFKEKILEWGYKGEVILETTNVDSSLIEGFSIEEKLADIEKTNKIKILFLARLIKEKGVFESVDAFRELKKDYHNIELIIAGDGKYLNNLKDYVKKDTDIFVTGRIEGQEKVNVFTESHIYCFPTFYGEGLPTSILEAMAFGMPIITTPVGGLKYFFRDEKMGYFVEQKNVNDIIEKLDQLLSNKNKLIEIGENNHLFAIKHLINTVVAKRLLSNVITIVKA